MTSADYSETDICDALRDVGIENGETVFTHSNLGFFGQLKGAETKTEYCESFYRAVRDVIGEEGTFVVPTFSYSFTDGDRFIPTETESNMGMLAEYVRTHPDSVRSSDPNFSVAAIGPLAERLTADPATHSFGQNSFWERFFAVGGKFCNFNMDAASTFLHYVERCLDIPYRWDKPFAGIVVHGERETPRVFYHYVRALDEPAHEPDFAAFDERAREDGVVKQSNLGRGQVVCITAQDTYDVAERAYLEDPAFLIEGDVNSVRHHQDLN